MLKALGRTSSSPPSQGFLQLVHLWRKEGLGNLQIAIVQREKFYLRSIKHDGMPYAVVPEHLILAERQVTRQEFTLVMNDLIKRFRLGFGGMGSGFLSFITRPLRRGMRTRTRARSGARAMIII